MTQRREGKRDSSSAADGDAPAFSRLAEGEYHRRLAATRGVAVVLFSAPHCGACRAWRQLLPLALAGVADSFREVDVSEATGVARYFGIFHLPTVYLYRNGQFHAELQCAAQRDAIRETACRLLATPAQEEP